VDGNVEVSNLTFRRRGATILDGVTASFPAGAISLIFGPNGAGKTTLLRCLSGDLEIECGVISVEGIKVDPASEGWMRRIGVVPDADALIEDLTVREQLALAAHLFGIAGNQAGTRIDSLIRLSDLEQKRHQEASSLSAGMRKRLAVALALVHGPQVLMFDEPLNGMDYTSSETFFSLLRLLRGRGRTILISGHALPALLRVADRVVELDAGKVVGCLEIADTDKSIGTISQMLETTRGHDSQAKAWPDLEWLGN
jgi:ABC-2 type transport system ATP-binding protein